MLRISAFIAILTLMGMTANVSAAPNNLRQKVFPRRMHGGMSEGRPQVL
jgi:hypothetical protein